MTATVAFCPPLILQFFDSGGRLLVGGSVLTQVGGTNTATYQDSGGTTALPNPIPLNSRGEISNSSGQSQQLFLIAGSVYTLTIYDAAGNQIDQAQYVGNSLSGNALVNATLSGTTTLSGTLSGGTISGATLTTATITSPTISSPTITGTITAGAISAGAITSSGAFSATTGTFSGTVVSPLFTTAAATPPSSGTPLYLSAAGVAGASAWEIDTSQFLRNPGVTQPQFFAQLTSGQTSGNDIIWNSVPSGYGSNRGTMLNLSTGVATMPVDGDYLLTFGINVAYSGAGVNVVTQINRNGSNIIPINQAVVQQTEIITFSGVLTLAANDTIKVTRTDAAWSANPSIAAGSYFSMRLLG